MKRLHILILTLYFIAFLPSPKGWTQNSVDYIHYDTLTAHTNNTINTINSVAFSPNGVTLASGSSDKNYQHKTIRIRLWDITTGKMLRTFMGHTDSVNSVAFNPDGRILASGSSDKTIKLWDITTGKILHTFMGHTDSVNSVVFSPDGRSLASGSSDKTIKLWDITTGKILHTLIGHKACVNSVAFSPDGKILACGAGDLNLNESEAAAFVENILDDIEGWNGIRDNSIYSDNTIRLWDVATGTFLKTLTGHTSNVNSVTFSPNGHIIVSGSRDGTVRLWDAAMGTHLRTLAKGNQYVLSVAFSAEGSIIASSRTNDTIDLWDAARGTHLKTLTPLPSGLNANCVTFNPNGRGIASGDLYGRIRLWKLSSEHKVTTNTKTSTTRQAEHIYNNTIRSVMWIVNPGIGEGSGVLLDKKTKLAVTNAHVIGPQNTIDIYFPAPDEKGELIKDRNFYLTNGGVLKRLGYYTKGHVIAKNEKTDLAIIRLDGLPETVREIDWKLTPHASKAGELVYILGNPAKQELWRWTLGEFLNDHGDCLHIQSDVFGGNSGGPVLNKQGLLIGIVARSDELMNAAAIPTRHINKLLSESKVNPSSIRR